MESRFVRVFGWVIVAAAVIGQVLVRPSPDVSWLLYATQRILHGARLGVDILEVTPPMIFLPKLVVVSIANTIKVGIWQAWVVGMIALTVGSIILTVRLLPALLRLNRTLASLAPLVIAFVMLVVPGADFGQREHLTAILVLPYVVLASRRLTQEQTPHHLAVITGVMAGIGLGIKPLFIILFAGLLGLQAWRLGRGVLKPEHWSLLVVGACYLVLVGVMIPGYYAYAMDYGTLYMAYLARTPWQTIGSGPGSLPGLIAIGIFGILRRSLTDPRRALAYALATAVLAFYLAAVLHGKGWRYQFLPSILFGCLLIGLAVSGVVQRLRMVPRLGRGLGVAMAGLFVLAPIPGTINRLTEPRSPSHDADPNLATLVPIIRQSGDGVTLAVLSSNIASAFPLVLESGAEWTMRSPSLWPLIAFVSDPLEWGRLIETRTPDRWGPLEREFVAGTIANLIAERPKLLLVLRPSSLALGWGGARQLDYLAYFLQQAQFRDFFAQYHPLQSSGDYDLYERTTAGTPSSP